MSSKGLIPVGIDDVAIGVPIEWTLFDDDGNVACRPGHVFRNREQLAGLLRATGLFRARPKAEAAGRGEAEASRHAATHELAEGETTLDAVGLHIGESWQLQPVSEFDQTRYYVTLIGYLHGVSVIVTTPSVEGKTLLIRDGQSFIVRAFSGKSAYAFKTTVLRANGFPVPYLHLGYPEKVTGIVVRSGQRVDVNIVASVFMKSRPEDKIAALIKNVSKAGVSLETASAIGESGTELVMSFRLEVDDHEHLLSLGGIIRAQRAVGGPGGNHIEYGVQIVAVSPVDQLVLTAFVSEHLVHP